MNDLELLERTLKSRTVYLKINDGVANLISKKERKLTEFFREAIYKETIARYPNEMEAVIQKELEKARRYYEKK